MLRRLLLWRAAPILVAIALGALLMFGGGVVTSTPSPSSASCAPSGISVAGSGAIAWPMKSGSYRLTSGYGPRGGAFHAGIDLAAPIGTPIYAAHDGVVAQSKGPGGPGEPGVVGGFESWVVLNGTSPDGSSYSTVYGHVNSYSVSTGQTVAAGQQIATVGARGQATGPHLHFEVWPGTRLGGGHSVDPAGWLAANVGPGQTPPPPPPAAVAPVGLGTPLGPVNLSGPVPPQGRQITFKPTPEQQGNVEKIVGTVKGAVPDDPATPVNEPLRVAVIAVAAAIQESDLRVIDFGDAAGRDSRGLYQQRTDWGPYPARMDPVQSTLYFLNGGAGGQPGLLSHDWKHSPLESVVVATQISVGGYAKWEALAEGLVAAAAGVTPLTAGNGATPSPCGVPAVL